MGFRARGSVGASLQDAQSGGTRSTALRSGAVQTRPSRGHPRLEASRRAFPGTRPANSSASTSASVSLREAELRDRRPGLEGGEVAEGAALEVPRHLAVIMDGNYRWAAERGRGGEEGHSAGIGALRRLVECSVSHGIEAVTVYAFSVDNWKRGEAERRFIFSLFETCLTTELPELLGKGVRVRFIGDRAALPASLRGLMETAESATREKRRLHLTIAINYSAREDLAAAARAAALEVAAGRMDPSEIDEGVLEGFLSTAVIPRQCRQPDLLIRTSGEERLSNFLLWELAYTELCFTDVKWPDFDEGTFREALREYSRRERRYGGRGGWEGERIENRKVDQTNKKEL